MIFDGLIEFIIKKHDIIKNNILSWLRKIKIQNNIIYIWLFGLFYYGAEDDDRKAVKLFLKR